MEPFQPKEKTPFFQSNTAKMIMVGMLTLVLLIPLQLVKNLITERAERQKEVIAETSGKWGDSVYFYGPIVKIPYKTYEETTTINEQTKTKSRTAENNFFIFNR